METISANYSTLFSCVRCGFTSEVADTTFLVSTATLASLSISNDPPSDVQALAEECKVISQAIRFMVSAVVLLQIRIEALNQKRKQLGSSLELYKLVLSPCRRLPTEILERIFALCISNDTDIQTRLESSPGSSVCPSTLSTAKSPWVLGQVCRRWRELVLSIPAFWTAVDINWEQPSREVVNPFIIQRLSLTLQRSRDRPLYLSWNERSCRDRTALFMLCSRSFQWKSAALRAGIEGLRSLVPYSGSFAILSALYIDFAEEDWLRLDLDDAVFSVFRDLPGLRHVHLLGDHSFSHLTRQIPWDQITHLTVQPRFGTNWGDFRTLLRCLVQVEELILSRFDFTYLGEPPFTLARLHTLHCLHPADFFTTGNILNSLVLPSLRVLEIAPVKSSTFAIRRLLDRSACQLEELTLKTIGEELGDLLKVPQVQTVRKLSAGGAMQAGSSLLTVSDTVLDVLKLGESPNGTTFLPHLRDLTIIGNVKNWSDWALVEMLTSRRDIDQFPPGSVSRLECFRFLPTFYRRQFQFTVVAAIGQLRQLVEEGLVIGYPGPSVLLGNAR